VTSGKTQRQTAQELGVIEWAISTWKKQLDRIYQLLNKYLLSILKKKRAFNFG